MLKGAGDTTGFDVVLEIEVLAILQGGGQHFHPLKVGSEKVLHFLEGGRRGGGGGAKGFRSTIFQFCLAPCN